MGTNPGPATKPNISPYIPYITQYFLMPNIHCTISGCPGQKMTTVKQLWRFFWSWLLNCGPMSDCERGSKMAVVTVLRPEIVCDNFLAVSEI